MPEHVHLVLHPPEHMKLGSWIRELKSRSARSIFNKGHPRERTLRIGEGDGRRRVFWQLRCYDHNCRTDKTVREKIEYCHRNPVTRGLVDFAGEWKWSSFNWHDGVTDVPIKMDEFN